MKDDVSPNLGGRPLYEPDDKDRKMVEDAVAIGKTQDDIAKYMGIARNTLRRHFRDELDGGMFKSHVSVGGMMLNLALHSPDDNVRYRAGAYYLARRAGWKETNTQEQTGKDGGPIEAKQTVIYSGVLAEGDKTV